METAIKLPNLFIAGCTKSGTGSLHQYLAHHPEIFMSEFKEPRFFLRKPAKDDKTEPDRINNKPNTLKEYSKYFEKSSAQKIVGESSSSYIYSLKALQNIRNTIPNARLIISVRNPVDRTLAHWNMVNRPKKINEDQILDKHAQWIKCSQYSSYLQNCYQLFPRENVKIIVMEEWQSNVTLTLRNIYEFLDIDCEFELPKNVEYTPAAVTWPGIRRGSFAKKLKPFIPTKLLVKINKIKQKHQHDITKKINYEFKSELYKLFKSDIEELEHIIGREIPLWKCYQSIPNS